MTQLVTGADIRRMREAVGMTQTELADTLGYSCAMVCRWERGEHRVPRSQYRPLMDALLAAKQKLDEYQEIMAGIAGWPTIGTL